MEEGFPLLEKSPSTESTSYGRSKVAVGAGVVLVLFLGAVTMQDNNKPIQSTMLNTDYESLRSVNNWDSFAVTSEEIQRYGEAGAAYPWMDGLLIEPYSETTFYAKGNKKGEWTLLSVDGSVSTQLQGDIFVFKPQSVDEFTLTFSNKASAKSETINVYSRYIRREIRSLPSEKLVKFRSAFKTIIEIEDEVTGKKLYGDNFTPFAKLSAMHANLAGAKDCDHLHDGMGFVTSHVQMSRLLESSLQSIDPSLSLPYWEYTKDTEHIIAAHGGDFSHWKNIEIFSEQYFGYTNPDTAQIETGEFRAITMDANQYSTVQNSYGLMRAPWNNLGNAKMTRYFGGGGASYTKVIGEQAITPSYDMISTCTNLYNFFDDEVTSMATFVENSEGLIHGPIHLITGGIAGTPKLLDFCKNTLGLVTDYPGYTELWTDISTFFIVVSRAIYRHDLLSCPEVGACTVGVTAEEDCACTCDASEVIKTLRDSTLTTYGFTTTFSDWQLQELTKYYCTGGVVVGDQSTASAASDPSFYSLHGTVERYLQLVRLTEKFTDESWPSRENSLFSTSVHPFSKSCSGHYEDDMLLFGAIDGNKFTNVEYYSHLDPRKNELAYVYDHFEFDHCTAVGIDIKSAAQP